MLSERPSLRRILSDTSRIITAHSRHFLALSILFLYPISLAAAIYTLYFNPLQNLYIRFHTVVFTATDFQIPEAGKSQLLLTLVSLLFSTCAVSSIAASTFDGFYGRPLEFISALRSVLRSFLPLLATTLLAEILIGLIVFAFLGLLVLAKGGLASIGIDMDHYYQSEYFLVLYIAIAVLMAVVVIYLQIEWSLSNAVVVVESDWGFTALRRSSYLGKGARGVMFLFILYFGVLEGVLGICYLKYVVNSAGGSIEGLNGWLVAKVVVFAGFWTLLSLYAVAALTVFFIYCKAMHYELDFEFDGKIGAQYVRLPCNLYVV